jgi:uncharacterized protein
MSRSTVAISRRRVLGNALAALAAGVLAGCGAGREDAMQRWHDGRLYIATGNTTGVFYQFGGGYADIISRHLEGYEATAEPTGAAVDNIRRVARGDADIALTFADGAADAAQGRGAFLNSPQRIQSLARVYQGYVHLVARSAAGVRTLADLRGKRVSTGSPESGTDFVARRLLAAAGIDPESDLHRQALSLPVTVQRMKDATLDAMFFTGGLPVVGITELLAATPGLVFIPVASMLSNLRKDFGDVYTPATIPGPTYGLSADVATIAVPNLIIVGPDLPDALGYDLTRLLFDFQDELAKAHPEGRNFTRAAGRDTDPVPLHLGARRYYDAGP